MKEYNKEYYTKNRDKLLNRSKERYYQNKGKDTKYYNKIETVGFKTLYISGDTKHYLDKERLLYETIVCQGRGKPSEFLSSAWITLIDKYANGWYWASEELKEDSKQHAFIDLYKSWRTFDVDKKNAFSYYTQIVKIAFYFMINQWKYEKPTNNRYKDFKKKSLDNFGNMI